MKHARLFLLMVATLLCSVSVKAQITAVSQLSNTKLYFVSQPGHASGTPTSWVILEESDALQVNSQCGVASSQNDANQQFAFVSNDGGDTYYLYHPVRKMFVNKDGSLGTLPMDAVNFTTGNQNGTFVIYFDASHVINTNDNDGLIINRWGPLSGWGSADEGNSCAITPVGEFDPTEALATFTAAEEEKRKIIEFSRGTDGWIDGTEWYDQSQTIVAYTSPLYRFTDKVETFRITVSLTKGNTKYFCLSELELYDADGNKIELTESNVTSNADHNALNPNTTDGGGLAALFDGQTSTYFHSAWQNMPAEDHYLEVTLPDGGYDAFSFRMVSRGIGTDGYTQYHTFPGDMVITTSVALESTGTPGGNDEPAGPLTELSAADPTKCYTVVTNDRGAWAVDAEGTIFSSTSTEGLGIDAADARQQFAILSANGTDYYLYSVSAKKFVAEDASLVPFVGDAIAFADASSIETGRVQVSFRDYSDAYINLGNQGQMTIDSWGTIDNGNAVLIAEAGDFDAAEALAILADPEGARKTYLVAQAQELLASNAANHAERPALGQYGTSAYENLAAIVVSDTATAASVEHFIAAFEASKCLPVFTIDGVNDYANGMSIYDDGGQLLRWKATDRSDESMLWAFDMTETTVGVTDKVVIRNLATGNLFMETGYGVSYIQIAETSENIADDGLFLMFREEDTEYAIWASHSGIIIPSQGIFSANSTSAWKFTYVGTTYGVEDAPETPDTPVLSGVVSSLADADPAKCYSISTNGRGAWAVDAEGSIFSATGAMGFDVDATDARQQFAILSANEEDYYLYSVSAKKFVKSDGSLVPFVGDAIEFADASSMGEGCVQVRFRDIERGYINLNNYGQMVIDGWSTIDAGNAVLIAEADDFDATEALAILANPEQAELNALMAQAQELLAANADNHAAEPALGQYATSAYEDLEVTVNSDSVSVAALEYFIAAFEGSKCLPVFTIDGANDYAAGMSIYDDGGQYPRWKATDRSDESMLWAFEMTDTVVGVTDKVVVKNLATGNLFMGNPPYNASYLRVAETTEDIADDGLFLMFREEDTEYAIWASQTGMVVPSQGIFSANSTSAWKFTYAGTTYRINELPEEETPQGVISSLSAADPTKCYTISTATRGAWAINDDGTYFSTTGVEGYVVDAKDARQQFAILSANGEDYYLYSVSAKKFVKCDRSLVTGVADALEFVDASSKGEGRVMVRFRDFLNSNINIGGDNQMVINGWNLIDEGNAVLIAEADDFDATEALAILANPEEAERNALIAQALELLEANADNHAVEPALGQYATRTYEYLDSVANSEEVTKNVIEDAISLFEASKCLPVFTINGVADFVAGKSIYEFNGRLYWTATDRTDESMLWMFDMTDTIVGVTDKVVVKNLATGRLFDNALFVQVAEPQDSTEGYWICPEGLGVPMFAYEDGRVERAYSWTSDSPHTWEFVYAGTTYDINELPSEPETPDTPDNPAPGESYMAPLAVKGKASSVVNIPIVMENSSEVVGFQFDLYLPEGVTVVSTTEDDETLYDITFNKERVKSSHVIDAELQEDGALRIFAFSTVNAAFVGNSGVVLEVAVNVGDLEDGEYPIIMRSVRMSDEYGAETICPPFRANLIVENTLMGDVNGDGSYTMSDVVMVINAVLEREQANFNEIAADMNKDGLITVGDAISVLHLAMGIDAAKAPARKASRGEVAMPELDACELGAMGNGRVVLPVALKNSEAYSAFQMDVVLPEGVELAEATLTGRARASHAVAWNTLSDGTTRVVAYALDNAAFRDNEGALLNLVLNTSDEQSAEAEVSLANGVFATTDGAEHRAADISVMMRSETTGVDGAAVATFCVYGMEKAVVVECAADTPVYIHTMAGQLVEQFVAKAGKSVFALPAGVCVVNGHKIIVK